MRLHDNPMINESLNNLYMTCDPRDQLADEIMRSPWTGNVKSLLEARMSQIDSRNQEYQDIQAFLNRPRFDF